MDRPAQPNINEMSTLAEDAREHPDQAIGLAFGVGTLVGHLITRGCACNDD